MFNFSKKKNQLQPAPQPKEAQNNIPANLNKNNNPSQTVTKVEDETSSFEIPDFTEDDLNFDLGIGEFIPAPDHEQQAPQETKTPQATVPLPVLNSGRTQQPVQTQQFQQEEDMQDFFPPAPGTEADEPVQEKFQPAQRQEEKREVPREQAEADEDDIPKFDIAHDKSISEDEDELKPVQTRKEAIDRELSKDLKKEISSLLESQTKKMPEAPHRGIFMPNSVYEKIVILTEDTLKQANYGEGAKTKISSLVESKKQHTEELEKLTKSIIDALLSCDEKLFEKVV